MTGYKAQLLLLSRHVRDGFGMDPIMPDEAPQDLFQGPHLTIYPDRSPVAVLLELLAEGVEGEPAHHHKVAVLKRKAESGEVVGLCLPDVRVDLLNSAGGLTIESRSDTRLVDPVLHLRASVKIIECLP